MDRNVRVLPVLVATLAATAIAPARCPALTNVPDPRFCQVESRLVGCPSGDALAACPDVLFPEAGFTVRVRDVDLAPLGNVICIVRFTDPAIRLFEDLRPGTTVDCINRSLRRLTDAQGFVTFAPRIGGTSTAQTAAEISAMTIILGEVPVTTTDLDGDGLTGLADFVILAQNYMAGSADRRTDYDGCVDPVHGATTLPDLVIFASQFGKPRPDGICN
jgi:hypothetical protein